MLLRRDITPHTTDMALALQRWGGPADTKSVVADVRAAARQILTLHHDDFARMVEKLLLVGRPDAALKLVDALNPTEPRPFVLLAVRLVLWLAPAAIIGFILWLVLR